MAGIDASLLLWFQNVVRNPVLDKFMLFYTKLGDHGMIFIVLALLLVIIPATRKSGFTAAFALIIGAAITCLLLKPFFMRTRPYLAVEGLTALVDMSSDPNSFPSGHTTCAFAFGMSVFLTVRDKRIKFLMVFSAVLMGISRLYVGVHYPTDVLAGMLIGTMSACLGAKLQRFTAKKIEEKKAADKKSAGKKVKEKNPIAEKSAEGKKPAAEQPEDNKAKERKTAGDKPEGKRTEGRNPVGKEQEESRADGLMREDTAAEDVNTAGTGKERQ